MTKRRSVARPKRERVRVREARRGRELLVDGTFASFYEPGRFVTGSVWDAIAAPLLVLPPARRRRILVLGLGGGSVARIVRALAPKAVVVGVEFDADVLRTARSHFDLDSLGIEVVLADARRFLREDRRRFDAVLEDVFVGAGDAVHKPPWLPLPGYALARERLAPGGLLVANALDEAPQVSRALADLLPGQVRIEVEDFDNHIYAAGPAHLSARELRTAVAASPLLAPTLPRLRFKTIR